MNKGNLLSLFLFLGINLISSLSYSQVIIKEEPDVASFLEKASRINNNPEKNIEGWRIQILATSDRRKMESELTRFKQLFPSFKTSWVYNSPYYKLRSGAYLTRYDALKDLYYIKKSYPSAYPAADKNIKPKELF